MFLRAAAILAVALIGVALAVVYSEADTSSGSTAPAAPMEAAQSTVRATSPVDADSGDGDGGGGTARLLGGFGLLIVWGVVVGVGFFRAQRVRRAAATLRQSP